MTSFNDLIQDKHINTLNTFNTITKTNSNDSNDNSVPLFIIDESIDKDKLAFEGIHYLDNTKVYTQTKKLGEYTLKMHQNTTLHYMISLEQMGVVYLKKVNKVLM